MDDLEKYKDLLNHQESDEQDEMTDFLRKSGEIHVPSKKSKSDIWDAIESSIEDDEKKTKTVPLWRYIGIAAAIALLVVFSIQLLAPSKDIRVLAETGESKIELLPDGSKVTLNASSSIEYSSNWKRQLSLKGEAFFNVTEGEQFIVNTSLGKVEVLGTSFNVFVRDKDFEVSCKTGKVRVTIPSKSFETVIESGEIIQMKTDTIKRITRTPELLGKWQNGEFYFEDCMLSTRNGL